jgi:hypothetical protein
MLRDSDSRKFGFIKVYTEYKIDIYDFFIFASNKDKEIATVINGWA